MGGKKNQKRAGDRASFLEKRPRSGVAALSLTSFAILTLQGGLGENSAISTKVFSY